MHRDLKLENLIFREKGDINSLVLIDFGLSTKIDVKEYLYSRCGTPGMVAPEVLRRGKTEMYDEKCDIFSTGVILFIMYVAIHAVLIT